MQTLTPPSLACHFIEGAPRANSDGRTYELVDPAHGRAFATVALAGEADVAAAVLSARRAFDDGRWSGSDVRERYRVLNRIADLLESRLPDFATLESRCTGRPIREMRAQLARLPEFYRYFAALARTEDDLVPPYEGSYLNYVRRVPLGVIGAIAPWNHPLLILTKKLAPALAAGNTIVAKPSELTPLTTLELAQLAIEAGLPPGVFNVITGFGDAGAALCSDPRLNKIDLTGGTETGRAVAQLAGKNLIRVSCELGGKAPVVILPDADLDRASAGAAFAAFIATGQTCVAGARILIDEQRAEAFVERLVTRTQAIRIGDPADPQTQLGPLVSAKQLARTEEYVAIGRAEGARVACGGRRPEDSALGSGHFYEPTVFVDVKPQMRIAQEEIFGPVTAVLTYRNADEAVAIANDIDFGLAASVWSADTRRAMRIAERLSCGIVWINDHHRIDPSSPWGGMKQSGIGRENGREAFHEYTQTRSVIVALDEPADWYATTDVMRLS